MMVDTYHSTFSGNPEQSCSSELHATEIESFHSKCASLCLQDTKQ